MENKFKEGDKVKVVKSGLIGWETKDWCDSVTGYDTTRVFTINSSSNDAVTLSKDPGIRIHPDHFTLADSH